ncbi:MAG TPA: hypothetical protein VFL72_00210, partial [Acidimicrobiia bacterium]|nr:hypothetical protein [Acidimicrobiia bacterium]
FASCWVASEEDAFGRPRQVTRCRIAGGDVVDYASDDSVPSPLYPAAGVDLAGNCWYLTSVEGQWIYLGLYINGDASLGWLPDPDHPEAIIFATGRVPRCTSEPGVVVDPSVEVWEYVSEYIHPPPVPDVNPTAGDGVTGMETFVGVPIPADHATQLSAGGVSVDIEIEVSGVIVDWGDGRRQTFPASETAMAGYPDGIAFHVYETKDAGYDLLVSYDWTARWRIVGEPWELLDVPNTTTSIGYPVNEIVSVITD